ncbi:winged helix-turn-helix transcriptional regulator [Shimia biformata]|uniref:winged helix-turn-helix transcriptional regulator n=1 Tax=Shimia biformata TaxID=1294299 RepID=UPI0019516DC4|nr:helix-turn-helix domain-containing protein [Shimia biformata]
MTPKTLPRFSILKAIQVVGDAWSLKILVRIFHGCRRFAELQTSLQISKSALTSRLDQMIGHGLLRRAPIEGTKRFEFRLDEAGLDLWEVLLAISEWELKWFPEHSTARPQLFHHDCGEVVRPILTCNACMTDLTPFNTLAKPGPGAGFEQWAPPQSRRRGNAALRSGDGSGEESHTLLIFGDRWTPAILATCFRGMTRFNAIESYLKIPPAVLAGRLNDLETLGVLRRRPVEDGESQEEFRLTRKGLEIFPYIAMLAKWGDKWMTDHHGAPLTFHHSVCNCQYTPLFRCSCCNMPLRRTRVELLFDEGQPTPLP